MFPFSCADRQTQSDRLVEIFSGATSFDFSLKRTGWFGDEVLWLDPEPVEQVLDLTRQISCEFGILPYRGQHREVRPHVTVGFRSAAGARLTEVANELDHHLPIHCRATEVCLVEWSGRRFQVRERFPLGRRCVIPR